MKQHITLEQLNELNDINKEELRGILLDKGYYPNSPYDRESFLPTIGQMIEFLDDISNKNWKIEVEYFSIEDREVGEYTVRWENSKGQIGNIGESGENGELIDALWEAVKGELEK